MRLIRYFQTMPLLRKLTHLFMLLVLIPCLLFGIVLYRQDLNRRIAGAIEQNQSMLRSMAMDIRIRAAQAEIVVEQLTYNASVLQMLSSKTLERQILALLNDMAQQVQNSETYLQHLGADIVIISAQTPFAEQFSTSVRLSRMSADAFFDSFWSDSGRLTAWGLPGKLLPGTLDRTSQTLIPYYRKIAQGLSRILGAVKCGVLPRSLFASLSTWEDARTVLVRRGADILYQIGEPMASIPEMGGSSMLIQNGLLYLTLPLDDMDYELLLATDYRLIHRQSLMASLPAMLTGLIAGGLLALATRALLLSLLGR
ncbi:MAG TPA: hypothetical protein PKE04_13235, partial [Clostridia bacterium]|nr:hypothetical protein [Clostridia bacterium]